MTLFYAALVGSAVPDSVLASCTGPILEFLRRIVTDEMLPVLDRLQPSVKQAAGAGFLEACFSVLLDEALHAAHGEVGMEATLLCEEPITLRPRALSPTSQGRVALRLATLRAASEEPLRAICRALGTAGAATTAEGVLAAAPLALALGRVLLPCLLRSAASSRLAAGHDAAALTAAHVAGAAALQAYAQAVGDALPGYRQPKPATDAAPRDVLVTAEALFTALAPAGSTPGAVAASVRPRLALVLGAARFGAAQPQELRGRATLVAARALSQLLGDLRRGAVSALAAAGAPAADDLAAAAAFTQAWLVDHGVFSLLLHPGTPAGVLQVRPLAGGGLAAPLPKRKHPPAPCFRLGVVQSSSAYQLVFELCRPFPRALGLPRDGLLVTAGDVTALWETAQSVERPVTEAALGLLGAAIARLRSVCSEDEPGSSSVVELLSLILSFVAQAAALPGRFAEAAAALAALLERAAAQASASTAVPAVDSILATAALDLLAHRFAPTLGLVSEAAPDAAGTDAPATGNAHYEDDPMDAGRPPKAPLRREADVNSVLLPFWGHAGEKDKTAAAQAALGLVETSLLALLRSLKQPDLVAWVAVEVSTVVIHCEQGNSLRVRPSAPLCSACDVSVQFVRRASSSLCLDASGISFPSLAPRQN